jgi:hypothetical protein
MESQDFKGAAKPMTEADLREVAASISVDVAALRAIMKLETGGKGFLDDGRPMMLFESQVFKRLTGRQVLRCQF